MWLRAHMEDKMHFEVILIVLLVVMCIAGLVMWTRLAASNKRTTDAPAGELEEVFRGGIMCRYVVTSGSLVRLELFDWGIRLRGTPISRWVVPTWEARYDELAIAELVALPASRIAVCFRLRGGEVNPMAFLSYRSQAILPLLESHGVPVNRSIARIRRVNDLYQ